jgi:glycerol-3-phosphate acyltransferase PlsY
MVGYLVGSVPTGLLVGRIARGIDIRDYGSGKTGFTNVVRTVGVRWGVVALAGDLAKGAIPVVLALVISDEAAVAAAAGLAAAIGHDWPVFAGFAGGRGVATSYGAAVAMNPIVSLALLPIGIGLVAKTRIMSLMSVGMAPVLAITFVITSALGFQPWAYAIYAVIAAGMVLLLHIENIQRLLAGTEPRLGQGGQQRPAEDGSRAT